MSTVQPYVYEGLSQDKSIRLLELRPGTDDEELECTLTLATLSDGVEYAALSYVWGDPSDTHNLICSKQRLKVTKNLYSALCQLRHDEYNLYLWVDAICINQGDVAERNQQVQMMGAIYARAFCVLVWLGPASEDDCEAFGAMEWLAPKRGEYPHSTDSAFVATLALQLAEYDASGTKMTHIARMLMRPWFQRIWVIQEVANANRAVLVCGNDNIAFDKFLSAFWTFTHSSLQMYVKSDMRMAVTSAVDNIITIDLCRAKAMERSIDLFTTLCRARDFKSTDPRDKLYALVGMARDSETLQITPDYNKHWIDAFKETAISDIVTRKQLRFLSCTSYEVPAEDDQGLPSWVPDWSLSVDRVPFVAGPVPFEAGGKTTKDIQLSSDAKILTLRGKLLSHLERTTKSQLLDHLNEVEEDPSYGPTAWLRSVQIARSRLEWLKDCCEVAFGQDYTTPELYSSPAYSTFLQILTCDVDYAGRTPSDETMARFKQMCANLPEIVSIMNRCSRAVDATGISQEELIWMMKVSEESEDTVRLLLSLSAIKRRFCRTVDGHLGYVPLRAEEGDAICVLYGGQVLYALRPDGDDHYQLIGECYLHGFMHGEAIEMIEIESQNFHIR